MQQFLWEYYSQLTKFVEVLAAVVGILMYSKFRYTPVKYFIWILVGIASVEMIGGYTGYVEDYNFLSDLKEKLAGTWLEENNWFYTLFWEIGATLAFAYYFRSLLTNQTHKTIIKTVAAGFVVASIVIIASNFEAFFVRSFPAISILSALVIIFSVVLYLVQILQSDELLDFYKMPNFYFAATLLIWILITTPVIFYDVYFSTDDPDYVTLKYSIFLFSNIFMYLTFTLSLIWCKPKNS
ncbi:MAG: hypothetical protein HKO96_02270 [Flavobacteriaceae bacterium]|nr:hypothetical protein [Bacteroidia bacterium]NNF82249.1 hypothetical protein [Flavobacteriaceae bacterium]NNK69274.1 hypothetical protein [Flavobacteriaceae bacterium]NNL79046.1 hypothetical protein [Flavobacteriaceae bacterium]